MGIACPIEMVERKDVGDVDMLVRRLISARIDFDKNDKNSAKHRLLTLNPIA